MKIAVYHNLPSGGALRVLDAYLKHYADRHEIELFLPNTANDEFVPLSPYVRHVHRFPIPPNRGKLGNFTQLRHNAKLGQTAAAAIDMGGFDVVLASASQLTQAPEILPYIKTPTLYYAPEYFRRVYDKDMNIVRPDIRQQLKKTLLQPWGFWIKRFDRRAILAATCIFTHSEFAAANLRRVYGVESEVIYLGVDSDQFCPGPTARQPFVLSVGALVAVKGHGFVIKAISTLPAAARPELVVVGDRGGEGPAFIEQAKRLGVKLTVKQNIPFPELITLFGQATALAAAQYAEPFGLITLEAMASATPVVAVAEGGLKETVTDGQTGLLTERNPHVFGAAIAKVFGDPALARKLGKGGRADVEVRWQWSHTAAKIDDLLHEVAGKA